MSSALIASRPGRGVVSSGTRRAYNCRRKIRYTDPVRAFRQFIAHACDGGWHDGFQIYACECGGMHLGHGRVWRGRQAAVGMSKPIIGRLIADVLAPPPRPRRQKGMADEH